MFGSLKESGCKRAARSGISAGMTVLVRAIRSAAPVGETGAVKRSIGRRIVKERGSDKITGKVGINVGKKTVARGKHAPHGHLVALGTGERRRTSGGSTGRMPANRFVSQATKAAHGRAQAAMKTKLRERLRAEVAKARRR